MSHYKPYPAYKDSGVEWLGKVPEHWAVGRLKQLLVEMGSGGTPDTDNSAYWSDSDEGIPWVAIGDMSGSDIVSSTAKKITAYGLESKRLKIWPAGTLLFSMYASLGHTAELEMASTTNQAILCLVPKKFVNQRYLLWWLEYLKPNLREQASSNTQDNLNAEKVRNLVAPHIPLAEQQVIADHLDRETYRIDTLITKKTRFIELLREKRQALITHAVTKGLDPNVKVKDSGVEWLGDVPEHWKALPLRRVVTAVKTGGTPSSEPPSSDADGLAWYTPGDFGNSLVLGASEKRVSSQVVASGEAKVYPAGSVMVVSIGATLGKVGYLSEAASANQQINAVIPNARMSGYFLAYSLSVKTEAMWFLANAATIGIMNQEKTKEIWLAAPSVNEQMAIGAYLDRETARIDILVEKTERSIELLKERRSALITAAVTGQIDLREAA